MGDSNNVAVIRCSKGVSPTLEIMPVDEYIKRLKNGYYDPIERILTGMSKPVELDSFEGLIAIEGELVKPRPHETLAR